jgi:hypothetical protein
MLDSLTSQWMNYNKCDQCTQCFNVLGSDVTIRYFKRKSKPIFLNNKTLKMNIHSNLPNKLE